MVSERETSGDSGTDYDNLNSSANTDNEDAETTIVEENASERYTDNRSANSTPTISIGSCELSIEKGNNGIDIDVVETPKRPPRSGKTSSARAYRIIDSGMSQLLLQQATAERLAAMQSAEKATKLLKRKGSNATTLKSSPFQICHSQRRTGVQLTGQIGSPKDRSLNATPQRSHFDVARTASFGGTSNHPIRRSLDSNRNSLPIGAVNLNFEPCGFREFGSVVDSGVRSKMGAAMEGGLAFSTNSNQLLDDDFESMQRLSFVSSSTGYSSARSSLRSSDTGDETIPSLQAHDFSIDRRLIARESMLSEARRLKLLKSGSLTQLDRIAMELLETERCYVNDLNDIIQGYLNFFVDHREEFNITVSDVSSTFGCIERIFFFNKHLFHQLDGALLNVVQMAKCFVDNADGFGDYVTYCTNYQKMVDMLSKLSKNNAVAETLAQRQSLLGHSLPLSAYLLKPVQRVLKYHLFMENILKQSADMKSMSESDRAVIRQALDCMTSQAEKINEEKKRVEHWERVRELQTALHRWCSDSTEDLSKYGDLLLEATFKLAGSKTNRQLFLFEEMLMIVKERNGVLLCKDYIMCSSIMINESISPDPLAFQVFSYDNPKIQYTFLASNLDQKRLWIKELKRMMLDHYTVEIPERTKILMLNMDNTIAKPSASGSEIESETSSGIKANRKVPKYLEKRRKSIDSNAIIQRAQRRNRSGSASRAISKASSITNLAPQRFSSTDLATAKVLTCTCSSKNGAQPSTSKVGTQSSASGSEHRSNGTGSSSFSNLFSRRKSAEAPSIKLFHGRKKSSPQLPVPSLIADSSPLLDSTDGICGRKKDDGSLKCTRGESESVESARSSSPPNSCGLYSSRSSRPSSEQIENTFAELYKELHLFITNAEALDEVLDKDISPSEVKERRSASRQYAAANRLDSLVNGSKPSGAHDKSSSAVGSSRQAHYRSKSLSKLDDALSSLPLIDSPLVTDQSSDGFVVDHSDMNDSEVFMDGSVFGKILDAEMKRRMVEPEEEDEPVNTMNWAESPVTRDRLRMRNGASTSHHRRRSSQVAEQVWRLRQKQNTQRNSGENAADFVGSSKKQSSVRAAVQLKISRPAAIEAELIREANTANKTQQKQNSTSKILRRKDALALHPRQRTPLTVEQCAQLNDVLLEPNLGVVKEMVRHLEQPLRHSTPRLIL